MVAEKIFEASEASLQIPSLMLRGQIWFQNQDLAASAEANGRGKSTPWYRGFGGKEKTGSTKKKTPTPYWMVPLLGWFRALSSV